MNTAHVSAWICMRPTDSPVHDTASGLSVLSQDATASASAQGQGNSQIASATAPSSATALGCSGTSGCIDPLACPPPLDAATTEGAGAPPSSGAGGPRTIPRFVPPP